MTLELKGAKLPAGLKELEKPPQQIFVRGNIEALLGPSVAIVGTRKISHEARAYTKSLAFELSRAGLTIISGLAFGADAAAHEGALESGGTTVAVLASGVEDITPRQHFTLGQRILKNKGALVSEYPGLKPAGKHAFLERNRIVAALSLAVIVTEAPFKSGALNTASHARQLGRPVMAVPNAPWALNGSGGNALIQKGAYLINTAADVLKIIKFTPPPEHITTQVYAPTAPAGQILKALENGPQNLDNLVNLTKLAIVPLLSVLSELELDARVEDIGGKVFSLKK